MNGRQSEVGPRKPPVGGKGPPPELDPIDSLWRWRVAGVVATLAIALSVPLYLGVRALRGPAARTPSGPLYVGSDACGECHDKTYNAWKESHHARAMLPARPDTVLGNFDDATFEANGRHWRFSRKDGKYFVHTDDTAAEPADFEVAYTFGWFPLQQYVVPFPGGRLQCLSVAWDVARERWFSLYPEQTIPPTDWLHWTRPALNWNTMCSECHSTGVRKRYDPVTDTYRTTWAEIFVGCEACHGPGSLHAEWGRKPAMGRPQLLNAGLTVNTSAMGPQALVNLCAPCHSRRSQLRDLDTPGPEPLDVYLPSLLSAGLFFPDGQILDEDYEYHSFLQSKMFERGVTCGDCHDVHRAKPHVAGNELCLRCHRADTYDTESHHFHKKIHQGQPSEGATCLACHMPGRHYMVVHFRRDHSVRVPRPDLSADLGVPNACSQASCHADRSLAWVVEKYDRWYGAQRKPHYGTTLAAAREATPEARDKLLALALDRLRPAIVRATAMDMLWTYPGEDASGVLEQGLADPNALIRRTAASRLRAEDPARFATSLVRLLTDPVLAVRIEAASRLTEIGPSTLTESQATAFRAALAEYRQTLAYTADMPSGRHNWGILEQNLGRLDEAEAQYRKALAIDEQFYPAKVNLALLLNRRGRNAEAEPLLREAARANPRDAGIAFNLGLLLAEMGNFEDAEAALRTALEIDPTMAPAAYNLAVLTGKRDPAQAAALCRTAAALRPDDPRYAFSLAYYLAQSGNRAEAEETLSDLLTRMPAHGDAVLMLAELYLRDGRTPEAAAVYDRALATKQLPEAYRARVAALRRALPD